MDMLNPYCANAVCYRKATSINAYNIGTQLEQIEVEIGLCDDCQELAPEGNYEQVEGEFFEV